MDENNFDFGSQNELNGFNEPYHLAAGSILTNYFYGNAMLDRTIAYAKANLDTVYHGIDCVSYLCDSQPV